MPWNSQRYPHAGALTIGFRDSIVGATRSPITVPMACATTATQTVVHAARSSRGDVRASTKTAQLQPIARPHSMGWRTSHVAPGTGGRAGSRTSRKPPRRRPPIEKSSTLRKPGGAAMTSWTAFMIMRPAPWIDTAAGFSVRVYPVRPLDDDVVDLLEAEALGAIEHQEIHPDHRLAAREPAPVLADADDTPGLDDAEVGAGIDGLVARVGLPALLDAFDAEPEALAESGDGFRHRHVSDDAAGRELRLELVRREAVADMVDIVQTGAGHVDDPRSGDPGHCRRDPSEDQHQGIEDEPGIDPASEDGDAVRDRAIMEGGRFLREAQSRMEHALGCGDDVEPRRHRLLELRTDRRHVGFGHVEENLRRFLEGGETARQIRVDRHVGHPRVGEGVGKRPARETGVMVDGAGDLEVVHTGTECPDDAASEGPETPQDDSCSFRIGHAVLLVNEKAAVTRRFWNPCSPGSSQSSQACKAVSWMRRTRLPRARRDGSSNEGGGLRTFLVGLRLRLVRP